MIFFRSPQPHSIDSRRTATSCHSDRLGKHAMAKVQFLRLCGRARAGSCHSTLLLRRFRPSLIASACLHSVQTDLEGWILIFMRSRRRVMPLEDFHDRHSLRRRKGRSLCDSLTTKRATRSDPRSEISAGFARHWHGARIASLLDALLSRLAASRAGTSPLTTKGSFRVVLVRVLPGVDAHFS